jgi:hypothetical protein
MDLNWRRYLYDIPQDKEDVYHKKIYSKDSIFSGSLKCPSK